MTLRHLRLALDIVLLVLVLTVLALRFYVYRPIEVAQDSMEPTLHPGDRLVVRTWRNKYDMPPRGAIVVIQAPNESDWIVKRVVGVARDHVELGPRGMRINRHKIREPYVRPFQDERLYTCDVGWDEVYVLGDNRPHSNDSRDFGPLKIERIVGLVVAVAAPANHRKWLRPAAALKLGGKF